MKVAILVDGGFYRRRALLLFGEKKAEDRAKELVEYAMRHLRQDKKDIQEELSLYRIFYYDCPPMNKKLYHPLLKKQIDYGKSELYTWMTIFLDALKEKRKVALRMGNLSEEQAEYGLRYDVLKKLCNGTISVERLTEEDFGLSVAQKGVDMKIGLDIASMAYKNQVDRIILISGDSDFVPAAKLARREGIDFILDPMWANIKPNLFEHIDGLTSRVAKPPNNEKDSLFSLTK
ncbi:NYN domain-containing protein [Hydrogeniiclostridium mannosilyticum]|uniref:NYN domain-containing protein n=1 Tax=Hydrogeniiclostridium mannosilyticum TaxID=2764322 RepID=UPI0018AA0164